MTTKMTPSQRKKINATIRTIRSEFLGDERINELKIVNCNYFVSVVLGTNRTDCDRYSPRNVYTRQTMHVMITPRGKVTLQSYRNGVLTPETTKSIAARLLANMGGGIFNL